MVKPGKKKRRSDYEYPYLSPEVSLASRREETEDVASYIHKCPPEVKAWMNQFMKEEVNADLTNSVFNTGNTLKDKNGNDLLTTNIYGMTHEKSVPLKDTKRVYDRNNERNRCDPRQNDVFVDQVPDLATLENLLHPDHESIEDL